MHVCRTQAPLVQSKFPGHGAVALQASAAQRAVARSQLSPSSQALLSTQPCVQAICPVQLHWIGSQTFEAPCALHAASVVHSPGVVLHAPQPWVAPGGAQVPVDPVHGSSAEQQIPLGQPSAGHAAGVSLSARQPRNVMLQMQPSQRSATHPAVTRQACRSRPWQTLACSPEVV